jgi:hypothetical protein
MSAPAGLRFLAACPGDAQAIAGLHAGSWQRHYRGAFSDAFLDHDAASLVTGTASPVRCKRRRAARTSRSAIPEPPQAKPVIVVVPITGYPG